MNENWFCFVFYSRTYTQHIERYFFELFFSKKKKQLILESLVCSEKKHFKIIDAQHGNYVFKIMKKKKHYVDGINRIQLIWMNIFAVLVKHCLVLRLS